MNCVTTAMRFREASDLNNLSTVRAQFPAVTVKPDPRFTGLDASGLVGQELRV